MAAICGNTGVPIGTETCKLCVSHGCDGYKNGRIYRKKIVQK